MDGDKKMRTARTGAVLVAGCLLACATGASAQNFSLIDRAQDLSVTPGGRKQKKDFKASSRTFLRYNAVGGNKTRSFFKEGWFYEEHVSLQETGVNARGNDYQFEMDFRLTNEDRVDPDTLLFQNVAYREWNDKWLLEVGDVFHEFNHLTLNRNLKGVAFTRFATEGSEWKTTMVVGVDKSRWRDLFLDTPRESLTRWVMGMRVEKDFRGKRDKLAFNMMHAKDARTSAPQNPGLVAAESTVMSFDGKKTINENWKARAVLAFSEGTANQATTDAKWGSAVNVDLQYDSDDRKVFGRTRFQSTDPDFLSLEGSPVPDFEKFDSSWRYNPNDQIEVRAKWEQFENNLDGQLAFTTETQVPSLGVTYRHPEKPFRLDLRVEEREIDASNNSQNQDISDFTVRAENRFGKIRTVLDFQNRADENKLTFVKIDSDQWTLSADTRIRRDNGVQILPSLSYQTRDQDNLVNQAVDDQIDTFTLRLGIVYPSRRSLRFSYRKSDRDDGQRVSSSDAKGWEINYSQPVGQKKEDQLTFRILRNENNFQVAGNDFDETSSQLSFTHRF
jgi:hypothetical protein